MNTKLCIFALIAFSLTGFAVAAYRISCIEQECERIKIVMLCIIRNLKELEEKNKHESH